MIWATSGVAFAAVVLIVLAVAYGFSGASLPAAERLTRLWQPPSADKRLGFRDKQKQKVQQMLGDVGRLVPTSSKRLPHTQRLMARAGFRRPESVMAMQGVKVLLPVALVALVYFTGLYHQVPDLRPGLRRHWGIPASRVLADCTRAQPATTAPLVVAGLPRSAGRVRRGRPGFGPVLHARDPGTANRASGALRGA